MFIVFMKLVVMILVIEMIVIAMVIHNGIDDDNDSDDV